MEHSKEFYERVIRVIDYVNDGHCEVSKEMGIELAGNYWNKIGELLASETKYSYFEFGNFNINKPDALAPILEDCKHVIADMENAEYDRNLANKESRCNIKYGKYGLYTAIVAIVISLVALALEIEERLG